MQKNRKIKNFIINPRFQLSLVGFFSFLYLLIIGILYINIYGTFQSLVTIEYEIPSASQKIMLDNLTKQKESFDRAFLFSSFSVLIIMLCGGIVISHRIAGPLHRMREFLIKQKDDKQYRELRFRGQDFFPELAEDFNKYQKTCKEYNSASWLNDNEDT